MTQPRTALVTGAARGIGAATALRLAADGYRVAVLDLREQDCAETVDAIRAAGGSAVGIGADVGSTEEAAAAVARVVDELGAPTVLVNNAGILRDNLLFKMTEDDWDSVMSVHLRGAFLMSRAVQKHQVEAGWGRIVNLSSTSALGNRGQANYATAKAGIQGFTKTLALELGRYGITTNAVAPGFIGTDMIRQTAERMHVTYEQFVEAAAKEIPVGAHRGARGHRARRVVLLLGGCGLRQRAGPLRGGRAEGMIAVPTPGALADVVGQSVTADEWFTVDQARIDAFADTTDDHQWIHVDPVRAAQGPFGATVAHGYLTLSLIPSLTGGLVEVGGTGLVVNYGLDKVRFLQPVTAGSRIRATSTVTSAEPTAQGVRATFTIAVEIEGAAKPALVAETVVLYVAS